LGRWGATPVIGGLADTPETPLLHMCYHTKFGRSRPNRMDVRKRVTKNVG